MKIKISNLAKISETEIVINGITVIAGKNNSGKSTIGKVVFSLFNSLNNMEDKIEKQRIREISKICNHIMKNYLNEIPNYTNYHIDLLRRLSNKIAHNLSRELKKYEGKMLSHGEIYKIVYEIFENNKLLVENDRIIDMTEEISNKIISIMNLPNNLLMCEIITRYFQQVFSGQINCLHNKDADAVLELVIKGKKILVNFKDNRCTSIDASYAILHEAFYIDNPFIIDELNEYSHFFLGEYIGNTRDHLIYKLNDKDNETMDTLFNAVIAKEKLEEINLILNGVIDGKFVYENEELKLDTSIYSEPLKLNNLSTGIKSFLIIKILLEKGILKEKDVLILDEPEIHLHPEWQMRYAEIIVLLLKVFDLSIIVTTHSPNFLEAIEYFSKKHNVDDKCKYYLSRVDAGLSSFEDVTEDLNKIYKQMVQPSVLLDKLKYEMDNENEN